MANAPHATLDLETRSRCDLKSCGTWRYSVDPSTEVLVARYRLPGDQPGQTREWRPGRPPPADLFGHLESGGTIEAHNAWFEASMWENVLVKRAGWPSRPTPDRWRCSAAKAAASALPRNLEDAVDALGLSARKDMEGHTLMKRVSNGLKPPPTAPELDRLSAYCAADVLAEEGLSAAVPDLSPAEQAVWELDFGINRRGFMLDVAAADAAAAALAKSEEALNAELAKLTDNEVERATQRERVKAWLRNRGVVLEDTQGATLDAACARTDLGGEELRVLQLVRALGRTSTAKYTAMQDWADPSDGRARGSMLYHGAHTGRWSGRGIQPHNFPRGKIGGLMEAAWELFLSGELELLFSLWGGLQEVLSWMLRGAIVAPDGRALFVADYAGIEARKLMWLAGEASALEAFRRGVDVYCDMASAVYLRKVTKADEAERFVGKQAVLGLGFGMGPKKFRDHCLKVGGQVVPEETAAKAVSAYRETMYPRVPQFWRNLEKAATHAVMYPWDRWRCGRTEWRMEGRFLRCRLPSGRDVAYCDPAVVEAPTPWGEVRKQLTYMGVDPYTHRWRRLKSFGGLLAENVVQASSRDLMADAMARLERADFDVVLTVHDELVAEGDPQRDPAEFGRLVAEVPGWAEGLPVKVEQWCGGRYRK